MSDIRASDGGATVTIAGLAEFERSVMAALESSAAKRIRAEMDEIATRARALWYGRGGVRRVTGKSGDIRVYVRTTATQLVLSIGSTDTRTAGGKAVPIYVHTPSAVSRRRDRGNVSPPDQKQLEVLVKRPMRAAVKRLTQQIAADVAAEVRGG